MAKMLVFVRDSGFLLFVLNSSTFHLVYSHLFALIIIQPPFASCSVQEISHPVCAVGLMFKY